MFGDIVERRKDKSRTFVHDGPRRIPTPPAVHKNCIRRYISIPCTVGALTEKCMSGDHHLLYAARTQARDSFNNLRSLNASSEAASKGVAHAEEVAKLLKHNIVQAKKVEGKETYRMAVAGRFWRSMLMIPIELRIHEDTERGENDTVKNPAGGTVKVGKACS